MKARPAKTPGGVVLEVNRRDDRMMGAAEARSPFRIHDILVPVDFSACSRKALQYAIPLAKQHHAVLTLIHAASPMPSPGGEYISPDYVAMETEVRTAAIRKLKELAAEEVPHDLEARYDVRTGSAAGIILEAAMMLPADMIVISTHGRSGLKHMLLGSVTEHVVRHAPCPVLVVREHEHEILEPSPGAD